MKRLLIFILLSCLSIAVFSQQKPAVDRSIANQVIADKAMLARYFFNIPRGGTPGFPAYVPDSLKNGALYNRTGSTAPGLYRYNGTTWALVSPPEGAQHYADSLYDSLTSAVFSKGIIFSNPSTGAMTTDVPHFTYDPSTGRMGLNYDAIANSNPSTNPALNPHDEYKGTLTILAPHSGTYQDNEAVLELKTYGSGFSTSELRLYGAGGDFSNPTALAAGSHSGELNFASVDTGKKQHQNARIFGIIRSLWTSASHEEAIGVRATGAGSTSTSLSALFTNKGIVLSPPSEATTDVTGVSLLAYGSIAPGTASTYDVGTTSLPWQNGYINNYFGNTLKLGTNTPSDATYTAGIFPTITVSGGADALEVESTFIPSSNSSNNKKAIKARTKAILSGQTLSSPSGGLIGIDASVSPSGTGAITSIVAGSFYNKFNTTDSLAIGNVIGGWFRTSDLTSISLGSSSVDYATTAFFSEQLTGTNNITQYLGQGNSDNTPSIPTGITGDWSIMNNSTRNNAFGGWLSLGKITAPGAPLDVDGGAIIGGTLDVISTSTPQIRITNGANTGTVSLTSGGNMTFTPSGGTTAFNGIGSFQKARFNTSQSAYDVTDTAPLIYGTSTGGVAFPYLEAGSLVISSRPSMARDILFVTGATPTGFRAIIDRVGNFGVGTGAVPSARVHIISTTEQLRSGWDASNYLSFVTNSTGTTTITPTGTSPLVTLSGTWNATTQAVGTNNTTLATSAALFAERTATATLTNKTLTAPQINSPLLNTTSVIGQYWIATGTNGAGNWATANLSGSASLDFPNTTAGSNSSLTITVTGAAMGDVVALGLPNGFVASGNNFNFSANVVSADTVRITFYNNSPSDFDPSSVVFSVKVFK